MDRKELMEKFRQLKLYADLAIEKETRAYNKVALLEDEVSGLKKEINNQKLVTQQQTARANSSMLCWHCKNPLTWGGDHDIEEEDETYCMVTNLSCQECGCHVDVYLPKDTNQLTLDFGLKTTEKDYVIQENKKIPERF
jgi:RNase P subunit RPR2